MSKIKRRLKNLYSRLVSNIKRPEMMILPGQLAFFFIMTIITLVALFISIFSFFNISTGIISSLTTNEVPKEVINVIKFLINNVPVKPNAIILFITTLIIASNGTHSMIVISNKMYRIKDKSYIARRIKAILMLIVLIVLLLFIILVPLFGDTIIKTLLKVNNNSMIKVIYNILKYPVSVILIFFAVKLLYIMAPDCKIKAKQVNYGALFTSCSWVLVSALYSLYVRDFTNYNSIYGNLSNILVLMFWLYILSYIFVLGIGLNVTTYQLTDD